MEKAQIIPFIEATLGACKDFFGTTAQVGVPYLMSKEDSNSWDVSAFIGISGDSKGLVVISFPADVACKLTSMLVGTDINDVNDDVVDTIGEAVNIIAGNAKKGYESYRLSISLPSVTKGKNHKLAWPDFSSPIIGIPFTTDAGEFLLSVALEEIIR
ncbi:chemotaxis protein CheX [Spirochaetia bacterium 38H-sp]|uniref:Chemotaxis protein CheX n=1 Tax=Rarispira pelagica TaxID=3141764 RepID=A0ABU9UDW6_9SPIR